MGGDTFSCCNFRSTDAYNEDYSENEPLRKWSGKAATRQAPVKLSIDGLLESTDKVIKMQSLIRGFLVRQRQRAIHSQIAMVVNSSRSNIQGISHEQRQLSLLSKLPDW